MCKIARGRGRRCGGSHLTEGNIGHLKLLVVKDSLEAAVKHLNRPTQRSLHTYIQDGTA